MAIKLEVDELTSHRLEKLKFGTEASITNLARFREPNELASVAFYSHHVRIEGQWWSAT